MKLDIICRCDDIIAIKNINIKIPSGGQFLLVGHRVGIAGSVCCVEN